MSNKKLPSRFKEINDYVYAGFMPRFVSLLLDSIILILINLGLGYIGGISKSLYTAMLFPQIALLIFMNIWLVWKYGGSPGKLIVGIKIIQIDGKDVSLKKAQLRYLVDFIFVLFNMVVSYGALMTLSNDDFASLSIMERGQYITEANLNLTLIGTQIFQIWVWGELIVLLTNKRKRAIHDFIAGTAVIMTRHHNKIKELMEKGDL